MTAGILVMGLLMSVALLPQVLRLYKRRSSEDVSLVTLTIFAVGNLSWIVYGWYRKDVAIVVTNTVAMLFALTTLGLAIRFR